MRDQIIIHSEQDYAWPVGHRLGRAASLRELVLPDPGQEIEGAVYGWPEWADKADGSILWRGRFRLLARADETTWRWAYQARHMARP